MDLRQLRRRRRQRRKRRCRSADRDGRHFTRELEQVEGVADAHHVHAWALTSGRYVFSGHMRVAEGADPGAVLSAAHRMLKARYGFFFVTLQMETVCLDESGAEAIDVTHAAVDRG